VAAVLLGMGVFVQLMVFAQPGFSSSVSSALLADFVLRFGPPARSRVENWQLALQRLRPPTASGEHRQSELELLNSVNDYFNRNLAFVDDLKHWGVADYWASPGEFVASGGGDCEDFALAKYFALKELGVPISRLRIAYVKAIQINQPHMVLSYYATIDGEPLILDNLVAEILPAAQRPDLMPVYTFNDDDLWMARGSASTRAGNASQIRLWRALQDKMQREQGM
jgi:predicted transglutaminase-like cysteine proteinase